MHFSWSSAGALALRVSPCFLLPGWADCEAGVAGRRYRLQRDQVDPVARGEAFDVGGAEGVGGVAAAGDEEDVGLGGPAISRPQPASLHDVRQRTEACVRDPVGDVLVVVVAVV